MDRLSPPGRRAPLAELDFPVESKGLRTNSYWDHARHAIVDKNQYGRRANDAGPLWLGLLLNS